MNATEALTFALLDLADDGRRTPCQSDPDRDAFTSDDYGIRTDAAPRCLHCPVLDVCHAAGETEAHGVWGGTDRTPTTRKTP